MQLALCVLPAVTSNRVSFKRTILTALSVGILTLLLFRYASRKLDIVLACAGLLTWTLFRWDGQGHPLTHGRRDLALSSFRAQLLLATLLAILAVDSPSIFSVSLMKCEYLGVSMMDMGVAGFLFSCAAVFLQGKSLKPLPLIILGVARPIVLAAVNYQTHVGEYGLHWNFFGTLAFISLAHRLVQPRRPLMSGIVLLVVSSLLLGLPVDYSDSSVHSIAQWGLDNHSISRHSIHFNQILVPDFISGNKEGILSLPGSLSFLWLSMAALGWLRSLSLRHRLITGVTLFGCLFAISIAIPMPPSLSETRWWLLPSRRLFNLPFVLSIVALNSAMYCVHSGLVHILGASIPNSFVSLLDSQALSTFVISNLLTGAANLAFPMLDLDASSATCVVRHICFFFFSSLTWGF